MNCGNTPTDLQDLIVDEMNKLFENDMFKDTDNGAKRLTVYKQDLPIPEAVDDAQADAVSVPYAIVKISKGGVDEENAEPTTDIIIVVCVYDDENGKQAYRDVIHIINVLQQRFMTKPIIGNFRFTAPFQWALQDTDDTYPYFFGAAEMTFSCANIYVVEDEFT